MAQKQDRTVRVIKRGLKANTEMPAESVCPSGQEPSERELKTVVSSWVREHRQHSEEFRRTFTSLLREVGFRAPSASRA
jgi:hypothetical protein